MTNVRNPESSRSADLWIVGQTRLLRSPLEPAFSDKPACRPSCAAMAWSWTNQGWWQGDGRRGASSSSWQGPARRPASRGPYQPDRAKRTGGGLSPPLPEGMGDKKPKHIGGISAGEGMWRLVQRNPSPWDSCRMVQWPSHLATIQSRNPAAQPATLSFRPAPRTSKHLPTSLPMTPRQVCQLIVHSEFGGLSPAPRIAASAQCGHPHAFQKRSIGADNRTEPSRRNQV